MNKFGQMGNILKEAKSVDSTSLQVDKEFKESLRETLYENYLNQVKNGGSIMAKIKSITLNWKVALLSFGVLVVVAAFVGAGISLLTRQDTTESTNEEVLLAASLAVADGEVMVKKEGEERWMEAKQGDTISQGDAVKTSEESRAVLEIDNGNALRLNSSSQIQLASMKPDNVMVEQIEGESYSRVVKSEQNTYTVVSQGVEAQALGTAYTFKINSEKKQVLVYVYESKVKVNVDDTEVKQLKKAIVNTEKKKVEVKNMTEDEYKSKFAKWNKEQDKESGKGEFETKAPEVKITEPKDGSKTKNSKVTVKGTVSDDSELRKVKVAGKVYTEVNDKGKGFDPKKGTFNVDVSLKDGENSIKVVAYDIYWNASKAKTIKVTKEVEEKPAPAPESYFYVSSVSSPVAGKIYAKWAMSGYYASNGFKLVAAQGHTPVYPGDYYNYKNDPNAREARITGLPAGTYNVRVCIYDGAGKCIKYTSNMKTVVVGGETTGEYKVTLSWTSDGSSSSYPSTINLSASSPFASVYDNYKLAIETGDVTTKNGYKVCWDTSVNPTYPNDALDCTYVGGSKSSYTVGGLKAGKTYHFRVGAYKVGGGSCVIYSNDVAVSI